MRLVGVILIGLNISILGEATSFREGSDPNSSRTELTRVLPLENGAGNDIASVVSQLFIRIEALEENSRDDKQTISDLEGAVLFLESKLDNLEDVLKKDREKVFSLQNTVRDVEQRNLQLFGNGPISDRPLAGFIVRRSSSSSSSSSEEEESEADASVCMPRFVNNRCIFGGSPDIVAIRFENATFFNDNVEFNENVGFDEDADCMPIFNRTSGQCVVNNDFLYNSGSHQYGIDTRVTYRSRDVWMRPRNAYFRNTNTEFQGGKLTIQENVVYTDQN